nr:DUF3530 family protein [uncultured Tolumonas sp.]
MMRWLICCCVLWSSLLLAAETTPATAPATPTTETQAAANEVVPAGEPATSAATNTTSAASSATPTKPTASAAEPTEQDPEYLIQQQDWQKHPDARQFGQNWVLLHKSEQSFELGVAILLPEWQKTASLLPLSQALSRQGFDCVILLPTPQQQAVNPGDEKQQEAINKQLELWSSRLASVDENLNVSGGHRLVLAQGSSAVWLGQLLNADKLNKPDAIILLNAFYPDKQANLLQATQLSSSTLPILDLYQEEHSNWLTQAAQQRKIAAKRATKLNWRQQTINDLGDSPERIKGWLTTLGWK